jgi:hypothetical protein
LHLRYRPLNRRSEKYRTTVRGSAMGEIPPRADSLPD